MKKIIYPLLFLLFFAGHLPRANASHMMGAEITWTCVGQDSFLIKLTAYTDCQYQAMTYGLINFQCATSGTSVASLNVYVVTPVDITPVCKTSCSRCQTSSCSFPYGIRRYIMQGIVRLNTAGNCCNITVSWGQNARSAAITTITSAGASDLYLEEILNRCQNPCDNSPVFSNPPALILCVGQDLTYNNGVADIDVKSTGGLADSFTYEFTPPLAGQANPIVYSGQYAYDKPMYFWGFPQAALPFPRGIHLDPQTGTIQFRPMKAEATVMAVKVNEFRNKVKIGEIRRDIMVIVIACPTNNLPSLTTPGGVRSKSVCEGDTASFTFSTNDPNTNDTLTISSNNIPPGAIWTHTNGQSKHPTATLKWKAKNGDAGSLPYTFYVSVKDNACPLSASFSRAYQISVKFKINGNGTVSDLGCGLYHFGLDTVYKQKLDFVLKTAGKQFALDSTNNYKYALPGTYPYILTVSSQNGCSSYSDTGIITTDTFPYVSLPTDTSIYCGRSLNFQPLIKNSKGQVKYDWNTNDTGQSLNIDPVLRDMNIKLTVEDVTGCKATDSMKISLRKKPLMIPADTSVCFGTSIVIEPKVSFHLKPIVYLWNTLDTTKTIKTARLFGTTFISLATQDSAGCNDYNSMIIKMLTNYVMMPSDAKVCSGSPVIITPNIYFTKGTVKYSWSTGDTNKTITTGPLYKDSLISLTVVDSTGCTAQNSQYIAILKNPDITMVQSRDICNKSSTTIAPSYQAYGTGNSIVSLKWNIAGDSKIISDQSSIDTKDSGYYVFSITDKLGCSASDTIRIIRLPAIDTSLQVNGPNLTVAPGMKKYYWFWDNKIISSGTDNHYKAYLKGWYYAVLTSSSNCVDTTRKVFVSLDGINSQQPFNGTLKLYPNPTTGKLMLEAGEDFKGDINLSVFNLIGREILNKTFKSNDLQTAKEIDISDQPAGSYTVIIRYQNASFHQLIIKE